MLKRIRGYAASVLVLAILLIGCVSPEAEGVDVTSNCGPAPQRPGFPVESKDGRISMDAGTWHAAQAWMSDTAIWNDCVEGL